MKWLRSSLAALDDLFFPSRENEGPPRGRFGWTDLVFLLALAALLFLIGR